MGEPVYIKQLCHSDGTPLAIWHPAGSVYALLRCDDALPPDPEWLDLNLGPDSCVELASLRWEETGEAYDSEIGGDVDL